MIGTIRGRARERQRAARRWGAGAKRRLGAQPRYQMTDSLLTFIDVSPSPFHAVAERRGAARRGRVHAR